MNEAGYIVVAADRAEAINTACEAAGFGPEFLSRPIVESKGATAKYVVASVRLVPWQWKVLRTIVGKDEVLAEATDKQASRAGLARALGKSKLPNKDQLTVASLDKVPLPGKKIQDPPGKDDLDQGKK